MTREKYICKIASPAEMEAKWKYEIERHPGNGNWAVWRQEAIDDYLMGKAIPYYGILDESIICEATAAISPDTVQNSADIMDGHTAYLCAFRTNEGYRGKGYFSILLRHMLDDLKRKGFTRAVLGVEPDEQKNKAIYRHWGFTEYLKTEKETYPDGTEITVEYYLKRL